MSDNKISTFSKNLIRLRKERGLSQEKLAELSGLSQRMVHYYENGLSTTPIDKIIAITKALNVKINDLFGEDSSMDDKKELSEFDSRTIQKLKPILQLSKEDRFLIYTIIDALIAKKILKESQK